MTACQNTPKTPALDMANFDLSVAPNADFYEYATGGWQKNNPLKPEYARYGSFDILRDNNEKRINELFSGMTQQKAEPGSVEQKISDLYKMGLDSVRLNAEGAAPIKAAVDGILAIGDRSQLTAAVARLHSSIANPFFGVGVQSDLMNSDINALYASQPDLIMGDRDYYLDRRERVDPHRLQGVSGQNLPAGGRSGGRHRQGRRRRAVDRDEARREKLVERRAAQHPRHVQPHDQGRLREGLRRRRLGRVLQGNGHRRLRPDHRDDPLGPGQRQRADEEPPRWTTSATTSPHSTSAPPPAT